MINFDGDKDEREALLNFVMDHGQHELTVLHRIGIYRHLRIARRDRQVGSFQLITAPTLLLYRGDTSARTLVFQVHGDSLNFFRGQETKNGARVHRINPGYWAQKLPQAGREVMVYDPDHGRQFALTEIDDYADPEFGNYAYLREKYEHDLEAWKRQSAVLRLPRPQPPRSPEQLRGELEQAWRSGTIAYEQGLRELLVDWETAGVTSDVWEMDLQTPAYWYLLALHQIVHAVHMYHGDAVDYSEWDLVRGIAQRVGQQRRRGGFPRRETVHVSGRGPRPVETVEAL